MKNDRRFSRAWRRHHRSRLKRVRVHYWSMRWRTDPPDLHQKILSKATRTPASCSCWVCGNPRKFHGELTRQELLADQAWRLDDPIGESRFRADGEVALEIDPRGALSR